jgi:hypothetical protein
MSAETPTKSGQKSRYFRTPDFARVSNRKVLVTFRACFLLLGRINTNSRKGLGNVTAVTIRPTTERHSCLLRGRLVTRYFPWGYRCYFLLSGCDAKIDNPMAMTAAITPRLRGQTVERFEPTASDSLDDMWVAT